MNFEFGHGIPVYYFRGLPTRRARMSHWRKILMPPAPLPNTHEFRMRRALDLAAEAEASGEVPVGCVVAIGDQIVGEGRNSPIELLDPTAHAEMLALRQAALAAGNYRLEDATVYCTLEPCPMCAGAMVAARVKTLVFAARDLRFGGVRSKFQIADSPLLNHRLEIVEGVLGAESTALLQRFFTSRRK
jgi:tRNA(adenine34) deaminase